MHRIHLTWHLPPAPCHDSLVSLAYNVKHSPVSGFEVIDESQKVDEEHLAHYNPSSFYPVFLRNVFDSRYQVLSKLTFGSLSTVWLSRDIIEQKYVVLKACVSDCRSIELEQAAYAHLRKVLRTYAGCSPVRSSQAEFQLPKLPGVEGTHTCFVFEPLTIDLVATRDTIHFDEAIFKTITFHVFRALEFLHVEAQMVHYCRSPEDVAKKTLLRHDEALLAEYIRSNSKLTAQLEFMKNRRKKKQTDHGLAQDYRFIVSLYTSLQTMEFKPSPHRRVSSKAILSCLNITASWLSRAKQVVKLLDEIGPDGSSPDPMVIQRLQSKVLINKGSDLLTFLKQQDRARQVVHSPSP